MQNQLIYQNYCFRVDYHTLQCQIMNNIKRYYKIFALPLFEDNYSYVIEGTAHQRLVLVDPAEPHFVTNFLKKNFPSFLVSHVLYTHKHWDHAGGSKELYQMLVEKNPQVKVVIGQHDKSAIQSPAYPLAPNEQIKIGNSFVNTLHVPCHTRGHSVYTFLPPSEESNIQHSDLAQAIIQGKKIRQFLSNSCTFTGDTLFIGGIGRFFEGNATQMVQNIKNMYINIDKNSDIFCGHEYTLANLKWAIQVEKDNQFIRQLLDKLFKQQSEKGELCSLPSSLDQESKINVFVRSFTGSPLLKYADNSSVQLMRVLREMKNANATDIITFVKKSL